MLKDKDRETIFCLLIPPCLTTLGFISLHATLMGSSSAFPGMGKMLLFPAAEEKALSRVICQIHTGSL